MSKQVVHDITYEEILDFLMETMECRNGYKAFFNKWAEARGTIIDVFVEMLEIHNKAIYNTPREFKLVDTYRCLTPKGKKHIDNYIINLYTKEINARKSTTKQTKADIEYDKFMKGLL